mgnify:CR=1 FL=1
MDTKQEFGWIQSFEYNHELARKMQKYFLEAKGITDLFGSKTVTRETFRTGLVVSRISGICMSVFNLFLLNIKILGYSQALAASTLLI